MAISAVLTVFNAPYGIDQTMSRMWLRGKLAWGAGTYAAGGVLPNVPPYSDASGAAVLIPTLNVQPDDIVFTSVAGSGYVYQWNAASGKIQILESSAANGPFAELPNGALPAGVLADVIKFEAIWVKD
jgi:hypothetical protein